MPHVCRLTSRTNQPSIHVTSGTYHPSIYVPLVYINRPSTYFWYKLTVHLRLNVSNRSHRGFRGDVGARLEEDFHGWRVPHTRRPVQRRVLVICVCDLGVDNFGYVIIL